MSFSPIFSGIARLENWKWGCANAMPFQLVKAVESLWGNLPRKINLLLSRCELAKPHTLSFGRVATVRLCVEERKL